MYPLENNETLVDAMLDHKIFYEKCSTHDSFFIAMEDAIIEQSVAKEKKYEEWWH